MPAFVAEVEDVYDGGAEYHEWHSGERYVAVAESGVDDRRSDLGGDGVSAVVGYLDTCAAKQFAAFGIADNRRLQRTARGKQCAGST